MTLSFTPPGPDPELKPRIVVVGVGGAGGNAVNNMIQANLEGVEFVVANTDAQALGQSMADRKIQLGATLTQGLGAGARPDVGRAAAEEAMPNMMEHLGGANMLFITAGMGGGTGTGAAPVIAEAAREAGMLTVGVVTKPFHFEGRQRMRLADQGIEELQSFVDTLIIIPNQNLFRVANEKTTFADAFKMADNVLHSGVRGVTDLMIMPGLINLDFADIRTVMSEMGKAMMGTGEGEGEERARAAAEAAISNPLLDDVSMAGAHGVLINITGGDDMTLFEVDEAANRIREEVDEDANIIFGSTFDPDLQGLMRVSVVATGIEADAAQQPRPTAQRAIRLTRPARRDKTADVEPEAPAIAAQATAQAPTQAADPTPTAASDPEQEPESMVAETAVTLDPPTAPEPMAETAETVWVETDLEAGAPPAVDPVPDNETGAEPRLFDDPPLEEPAADRMAAMEIDPSASDIAGAATPGPDRAARHPDVPNPRDAFIPPPALDGGRKERMSAAAAPDPYLEAELANGRSEAPKKSHRNIFQRATSILSGRVEELGPASVARHPAVDAARQEPSPGPARAPATQPDLAPTGASGAALEPSKADEEMLEIPAFLRRQAN
ncbi:MAG: cell division protein FtsZ [Alphaproteobacteria bacterium]|nr:cell division protein FtsZ [Alphaproteobacteria bacterium]